VHRPKWAKGFVVLDTKEQDLLDYIEGLWAMYKIHVMVSTKAKLGN